MKKLFTPLFLVIVLAFTACGAEADWTQLKPGMTEEEVKAAFGEPNMTMTILGQTTWTYSGDKEVYFLDGKTVEGFDDAKGLDDVLGEVENTLEMGMDTLQGTMEDVTEEMTPEEK